MWLRRDKSETNVFGWLHVGLAVTQLELSYLRGDSVAHANRRTKELSTHWGRRREAAVGQTLLFHLSATFVPGRKLQAPAGPARQLKNSRVLISYICQVLMCLRL